MRLSSVNLKVNSGRVHYRDGIKTSLISGPMVLTTLYNFQFVGWLSKWCTDI